MARPRHRRGGMDAIVPTREPINGVVGVESDTETVDEFYLTLPPVVIHVPGGGDIWRKVEYYNKHYNSRTHDYR